MGNGRDLTGQIFGYLTVIKIHGRDKHLRLTWLCTCICGKEKIVKSAHLINGYVKSCGCYKKEVIRKISFRHGKRGTPEYRIWRGIKTRCLNSNCERYKDYGGRGIKICGRWLNSFENFLADMGLRPSPKHSIDRFPDNDGDYSPTNCRWATITEQSRNVRTNRIIEYEGEKMILEDIAIKIGVSSDILYYHLKTKSIYDSVKYLKNKMGRRKYLVRKRKREKYPSITSGN